VADAHGPAALDARGDGGAGEEGSVTAGSTAIRSVRTALTGEPGGVAYLEHLRARGMDDEAVLRRFQADLDEVGDRAAVYDHPYWAGIHELAVVERMIEIVRSGGWTVVPLAELAGVR
jgi:hypothetical protein